MKGIVIISGGMDSVTLAYMLHKENHDEIELISFNYGQRHKKELQFAEMCGDTLGVPWNLVDLQTLTPFLGGSALTDNIDVPDGHYSWDTMKQTVVPNRNAIMLSVATGIAVARGANYVATAVHAGDHTIYPDCRPEFIKTFNIAMKTGNEGFAISGFEVIAPFVMISKADIARIGFGNGVDFRNTWSCYKGGEVHCGTCGTCYERREAIQLANVPDTTVYLDNTTSYKETK